MGVVYKAYALLKHDACCMYDSKSAFLQNLYKPFQCLKLTRFIYFAFALFIYFAFALFRRRRKKNLLAFPS